MPFVGIQTSYYKLENELVRSRNDLVAIKKLRMMKLQSLLFSVAVFVAIALLPSRSVEGQACCAGGVRLSGSIGLTGAEKNAFQL
ncbi:MAG: hypothetical protein BRD50_02945, partial [Bacteroidetes bacterium SW_11_45_7]